MEIHVASKPFASRHSPFKLAQTVETWIPRKAMPGPGKIVTIIDKCPRKSTRRTISTASSAETVTSQDDYCDDTDIDQDDAFLGQVDNNASHRHEQAAEVSRVEECARYEILLWLGSTLGGVEFASNDAVGYPFVTAANGNESLPGMWNIREGDFLVALNEFSTHKSKMSFDAAIQVVASGARPVVLHFRRPAQHEMQHVLKHKQQLPSEVRLARRRNRERLEKSLSYVIWREEDGPLGVSLKKHRGSPCPVLADMNRSSVVRKHANIGDQLLSINQHEIHALDKKRWVQLLQTSPKPLVLTFRRLVGPKGEVATRTIDL